MPQSLNIVFHGVNRSEAVEKVITEKMEALRRFNHDLGACTVTVTQEGHQTIGEYTIRLDIMASGHEVLVTRSNMDILVAINEVFDTARRRVNDEAQKSRQH